MVTIYDSLNAPYGARCFLTDSHHDWNPCGVAGLNAPYGARCFLTLLSFMLNIRHVIHGLNAPYGARCFLTPKKRTAVEYGKDLS